MNETQKTASGETTRSPRPAFFCTSGPLPADRSGYLRRAVDDQLLAGIAGGTYLNVTGAPMSGKTSLLLRTVERLRVRDDPPVIALIDLGQLAQRDGHEDAARWFYAIAYRLARQLRVSFDLQAWWSEHAMLTHHQRFFELFREFALAFPGRQLVLMFDDIHELQSLEMGEQLLSAFRLAFDARATDPGLSRISVVLTGSGAGQFGHMESVQLPYAVATHLAIPNFALGETLRLAPALGLSREQAELAMQRIYDWVSGQPACTQFLAAELARAEVSEDIVATVDRVVRRQRYRQPHPMLLATERMIFALPDTARERALVIIGHVTKRHRLLFDPESKIHDSLIRSGVLRVGADGYLLPSSRLVRLYFNAGWANRHMPMHYAGLIKGAAVVLLLIALPVWYQLYLPKPHVAVMADPDSDIAQVVAAHDRLARWPGYADDAQRLVLLRLDAAASDARSEAQLDAVLAPLRTALDAPAIADSWASRYWRRALNEAAQRGDRAAAVHAALQSLQLDTLEARRVMQGLISTDLPLLVGALKTAQPFESVRYRPRDRVFVTQAADQVEQWALATDTPLLARQSMLQPQALLGQPVIFRQSVPRGVTGGRLTLRVTLQHERIADLDLTISAPSGSSATLALTDLGLDTGVNQIRLLDQSSLAPLLGGGVAGDWTLTLIDQRIDRQGSASVVLDYPGRPAGTDLTQAIPDPLPVLAANVSIDPRGRFAVAMPESAGDRLSIWDLRRGTLVSSIRVSAMTRLLGFANAGREIVLIDGVKLRVHRLSDGMPVEDGFFGGEFARVWLTADGGWLVGQPVATPGVLQLFSFADRLTQRLRTDADHEKLSVSPDGRYLASVGDNRRVSVWRVDNSTLAGVLPVDAPIVEIGFSPSSEALLITTVGDGLLVAAINDISAPLQWNRKSRWYYSHDPQAGLSLVGAAGQGFRLHDLDGGRDRSLPVLGFPAGDNFQTMLRMRENFALIALPERGMATLWRPQLSVLPVGSRHIRQAWLAADGQTFAFVDRRDNFSVMRLDAGATELDEIEDVVAMVAHSGMPRMVRFSSDGRFAFSLEASGLFRVRDVVNGRFFDFIGRTGTAAIDTQFSDDGQQFMILQPNNYEIFDSATGQLLTRVYADVPFAAMSAIDGADGWLLGDVEGRLLRHPQFTDNLPAALVRRDGASAPAATRLLTASASGWVAAVADRELSIVSPAGIARPTRSLSFGMPVGDMQFSSDQRSLIARAGPWLYRIDLTSARVTHSRLLPPDMLGHTGFSIATPDGMGVGLLSGLDEPALNTVWFDYRDQQPVDGTVEALRERWQWVEILAYPDLTSVAGVE